MNLFSFGDTIDIIIGQGDIFIHLSMASMICPEPSTCVFLCLTEYPNVCPTFNRDSGIEDVQG